jgi:Co/Zn/Cd efflux system component
VNTQLLTARKSFKRIYIILLVQKGRIILALLILMFSIFSMYMFTHAYKQLNSFKVESRWEYKDTVSLKSYPVWFYCDRSNSKMYASKVLSDSNKYLILGLIEKKHKAYNSFSESVNRLVYLSNQSKTSLFIYLLLLSGWSGVIGVQIRTIFDFIGRVCYLKNLVITVWWPWYLLRPLMGFIVGGLIVFLSTSHLLNTSIVNEDKSYIAVSTIAGFGVVEVIKKLRLISKTLFGSDDR